MTTPPPAPGAATAPWAAEGALLDQVVHEAGLLALDYFRKGEAVRRWEKNPNDPVSEADLAVDRLLRERLQARRPDYGWLSEETPDDPVRLTFERLYIVDPIDGTRAFLDGRPEFAVSVALVADHEPVAAAVYNPASDEFFSATLKGGAKLNGRPIAASPASHLAGARLLASRRTFERHDWAKSVPGASFADMNSIAYRMAKTAAGEYDATISTSPKNDWDIAAADLIVREAGGLCTRLDGRRFRFNLPSCRHPNVLAAGAGIHAALRAVIDHQTA